MKSVADVLQLSSAFLSERGMARAKRLAEDLIAAALRLKRIDLYMQLDRPLEEKELEKIRQWLKQCARGEPIDYIIGEIEFLGCRISVDNRVLIPRQETEILAEMISKIGGDKICWDVCTGSGCIGISLKKKLPNWKVVLSDLSTDALAVAQKNAQANGVDVELKQGDLLAPFEGEKADIIVVNPPYISTSEYLNLDPSVKNFEPKTALVGGERGTEFYEILSRELPRFLNENGCVFLEIGAGQGEAVKNIFKAGPWRQQRLSKDWAGHDRFFFLEKQ